VADKTGISWSDATWNPATGCSKVSPGCGLPRFDGDKSGGCYAMAMAARLKKMGQRKYQNDGLPPLSGPGFGVTTHPDALGIPLRWTKPRKIFVNSMSDLFHAEIPSPFIAEVFAVMAAAHQHTFQVLTKRHARMRSLLNDDGFAQAVNTAYNCLPSDVPSWRGYQWPLPNVWLGVSAEDQHWADIRIPVLLDTRAAVRWVSAEPLLGTVDFTCCDGTDALGPDWIGSPAGGTGAPHALLDWIVCGGESGPDHREMNVAWVKDIARQCEHSDVPIWVKQDSAFRDGQQGRIPDELWIHEFPREAVSR